MKKNFRCDKTIISFEFKEEKEDKMSNNLEYKCSCGEVLKQISTRETDEVRKDGFISVFKCPNCNKNYGVGASDVLTPLDQVDQPQSL